MGDPVFTKYSYESETKKRGISFESDGRASRTVAERAAQQARSTKKLDPSVDPATEPIHRSLVRFNPYGEQFRVTVGLPVPIESTCDVTGSMGDNVQIMLGVLPQTYGLISKVLPGCDPQLSLGIFGDTVDEYIMSRPQFEMTAEKIVEYCSHLFSSGSGGDAPEDPQYAAYAAAYLTDAYINRIGLKGYHFLITDAPMHGSLYASDLKRVFGNKVFDYVRDNGFEEISKIHSTSDMTRVFNDLNKRFHAFLLMVDNEPMSCWRDVYDESHIIRIDSTKYLPQVEAAIIGLTEATLEPADLKDFLKDAQVPASAAEKLVRQLLHVKYGAQRELEEASGLKIPKKGDIFNSKTDLQPCGHINEEEDTPIENGSSGTWL